MNGKREEKLKKMDRLKHSMRYRKTFWPELVERFWCQVEVLREAENSVFTHKIPLKARKIGCYNQNL